MITKKTLIIYLKFFKFKLFFNISKVLLNQKQIYNFNNILKIIFNLKNLGIFIPKTFNIKNNLIFSFWKKGFISNFENLKWFFINFLFLKKIPSILINLTTDNEISKEISKKKIPLIILYKYNTITKKKYIGDYFLFESGNLLNIDLIFIFIKTLKFIKNYKNV